MISELRGIVLSIIPLFDSISSGFLDFSRKSCSGNDTTGFDTVFVSNISAAFRVVPPQFEGIYSVLFLVATLAIPICVIIVFSAWLQRQKTYRLLNACGLPTVYWHPKFSQYQMDHPKHLSPSSITNILPRMQRLKGPYGGMYGTVYGLSTAVVHVAHPHPAMVLLGATPSTAARQPKRLLTKKTSTSVLSGLSWPTILSWRESIVGDSQDNSGTLKAPAYNHFKNFCGEGVFTADGEDWRSKRAAVLHALLRSGRNNSTFHEQMERESHHAFLSLCSEFDRNITENENRSFTTNVVPVFQRATIGLIYRYMTHSELSILDDDDSLCTLKTGERRRNLVTEYLNSISKIRMIILAQSRSIWFLLPRWCYWTFSALYKEEEKVMKPIRRLAEKACLNAMPNSPLRILKENPIYASATFFSKNLLDEAITILFAGQDTSAATLSWTMHLLTLYPHVQKTLADEVCNVIRANTDCNKTPITKKMISQMPYLDAVIKESMRLYPVAPFVVRKLESGAFIPATATRAASHSTSAIRLPRNSIACIWIYSLHRNPLYWSRPDEFQPERWLESTPNSLKDLGTTTPGVYIPFAAGARNCIGQPLANVMLRSLLAQLIHCYEFQDERVEKLFADHEPERVPLEKLQKLRKEMQAGFTVLPQGGLSLIIQHR